MPFLFWLSKTYSTILILFHVNPKKCSFRSLPYQPETDCNYTYGTYKNMACSSKFASETEMIHVYQENYRQLETIQKMDNLIIPLPFSRSCAFAPDCHLSFIYF